MSGLDLLHPGIRHHVVNTLGWKGLRPLQDAAIGPVLAGQDALLLAPTAGGKTEAAVFPLLSQMATHEWTDVSILYLAPLRALLNNLEDRLAGYCSWIGRSAAVWHGDVTSSQRRAVQLERPDLLLTTPESLESMLVSTKVEPRVLFSGLQAVVVDEVHAFAGDDRGWHLQAVLSRLDYLIGRRLQRIGMSATVGNPEALLDWLQGPGRPAEGVVVAPETVAGSAVVGQNPDVTIDHVGGLDGAATVIAALHAGEKRLVFVDSRRKAEELGAALRDRGITTFLSHSSLSATQRREAEAAFADERDCVIVATSTLELGIDVGDLDRVIQIDAPRSVASFLQRLGRTGRRPGTIRNFLFLCLEPEALLTATALALRWKQGYVEPVEPPPEPRHIVAQQFLAQALSTRGFPLDRWLLPWASTSLMEWDAPAVLEHLLEHDFLDSDGVRAFIGDTAETTYGRRHFLELLAVFTAPPQFTVIAGRDEIGTVGTETLVDERSGPRVLLLGGRSWLVTHIDWNRRRCFVQQTKSGGRARWTSFPDGMSFALESGVREVLLGDEPANVTFTRRARSGLTDAREGMSSFVSETGLVLQRTDGGDWYWWTWAGQKVNRTLTAWLPSIVDPVQRIDGQRIRLFPDLTRDEIAIALDAARRSPDPLALPPVNQHSLRALKFTDCLPEELALATVGRRLADPLGARSILDGNYRPGLL